MKTTIYWFSGTGNSLKIAKDLAEKLEDTELIPMAKAWKEECIAVETERVGLQAYEIPFWWNAF
jgi:flavodoxin